MEITTSPHPVPQSAEDRVRRIKAFFSLVYHYGMIQSNWVMKMHTLEEAEAAVYTIRSWNSFEATKVFGAIKDIWGDIMELYIGCEGSPVIYINFPYWLSQSINGSKQLRSPSEKEAKALIKRIVDKDLDLFQIAEEEHKLTGDRKLKDDERRELITKITKIFEGVDGQEIEINENPRNFPAPKNSLRIWWD